MFTGLVQDVGKVLGLRQEGGSVHLRLQTRLAAQLTEGDSLAVNGVCLTVTALGDQLAVATAIPETLERTTLGELVAGARVNLEPALRLSDRLGGHLVQGHVDGVGTLRALTPRGLSSELTVAAGPEILRYVVVKGSIAISGVSLTVAALGPDCFGVALIPHTQGVTTLGQLKAGARVNLEVDILAKYVERLLGRDDGPDSGSASRISEAWLREQGF